MKSITIHNLDEQTSELIKEKADSLGLSLNKTIKLLLKNALGLKPHDKDVKKKEFLDLFGIWDEDDKKAFNTNTADLNKIDKSDWQ